MNITLQTHYDQGRQVYSVRARAWPAGGDSWNYEKEFTHLAMASAVTIHAFIDSEVDALIEAAKAAGLDLTQHSDYIRAHLTQL